MDYKGVYPAGPKGHWLWGNLREIVKDPLDFSYKAAAEYPGIAYFKLMGKHVYVLSAPEYAKQVFITDIDSFKKGRNYKRLSLLGGTGLITSEGEFWKRQRRLAQPGFHKEKMNGFIQTFIEAGLMLAEKWHQLPADKAVTMAAEMGKVTLYIVGKTLFNFDLGLERGEVSDSVKNVLRFINMRQYSFPKVPLWMPIKSHSDFFRDKKFLDKVVYKLIDDRKQGLTWGDDLLQMFLDAVDTETGEKMEREHIHDEMFTIFLAGFETSSVALMWTWYLLSQNERVWSKFQAELDEIFGDKTQPAPEDIMKLKYTWQIVMESMRIYPPTFTLPRQVAKEVEVGGYKLPPEAIVLVSILGIHRNPQIWVDPEAFRPERFEKEEFDKLDKHAYIPFGSGQRMCIGNNFAMLEIVTLLAVLGRQFKLRPKEGYIPKMMPAITMNASEGMPMYIEPIRR